MKKIILFAIAFICVVAVNAQAPQGLNYQAVAYDNLSQPVTNHAVGVRLSVLDGSATGPVLYQETQTPNTDNTGLFSIVIGNGTIVSGSFAGINWGNGTKWLKTEIDIAGGNNYVVMGSSQFMSVPYALYADKTGFSSGSFTMPDGFDNTTAVTISAGVGYTVPAGKNLYITPTFPGVAIDGDTLYTLDGNGLLKGDAGARSLLGVGEGSVVISNEINVAAFLVDKKVEWKTFNVAANNFTVPANKYFVVVNSLGAFKDPFNPLAASCMVTLNGISRIAISNTVLDPGTVLSTTGCIASYGPIFIINGYFKNK